MEVADRISATIFALVVISVIVYMVMASYVVGPAAGLKKGEAIILGVGVVGIGGIIVYAASELLLHIVF
jgi:hypothetical protein